MPHLPLLYVEGGGDHLVFSDSYFLAMPKEITTVELYEHDGNKSSVAVNAVEVAKEEKDGDTHDHDHQFWYDGEHTSLEEKTRGYTASAAMSDNGMGMGERSQG